MKLRNRLISSFLILILLSSFGFANAQSENNVEAVLADTAQYIKETVINPQVDAIGGEWTVLGLSRSGMIDDAYIQRYYETLVSVLQKNGGVLHDKKYTEYSRVALALTAAGIDPHDAGGYNVLMPLGDFDKTVFQGVNGAAFALLALDSHNYEVPFCDSAEVQATRELYLTQLLEKQNTDGGFSLAGTSSDPDITGMALQAFAKYQDRSDVKVATDRALDYLSQTQEEDGGYSSWETRNIESTAQVILALCELGISLDDSRFVKSGGGLYDDLLRYYRPGNGFAHEPEGETNLMATEQALCALTSLHRLQNGKTSLYRMEDVEIAGLETPEDPDFGLIGKHPDIQKKPVVSPETTFGDIQGHANQAAIEALARRGMISGRGDGNFDPEATMTRAEFSTIVVRSLGLVEQAADVFFDVPQNEWYAPYIGTGYRYGLISGVSDTSFAPDATITREQAAALIARAAKLCGMNTEVSEQEAFDMLAQFADYRSVSSWAGPSLAFCYREGILSQDALEIQPQTPILRCEIAQMLYNLLGASKLL